MISSERITLNSHELLDSISQVILLFLCVPLFIISDNFIEKENIPDWIGSLPIILFLSLLKVSKETSIHNGLIKKEFHLFFYIYTIEKFPIKEIDEIVLEQNDELYFEIIIKRKNKKKFIVKAIPNKNPALKELELVKSYININQ